MVLSEGSESDTQRACIISDKVEMSEKSVAKQ